MYKRQLVIFGLVTYATKGVSFGSIEATIPNMIIPKVNGFPTIILWALAAIIIVWFIWNKTTFGKNLYAVGGNPEAAAVSGISVFAVTPVSYTHLEVYKRQGHSKLRMVRKHNKLIAIVPAGPYQCHIKVC